MSTTTPPLSGPAGAWWRSAVIYQVYLRSFADGSGDGMGDIAGLRQHLDHLVGLGVDALWVNPWYPSPMADAGYDVSDYRAVEPRFGTLEDAQALVAQAHAAGLRVLLDVVPNHTSDQHAWFRAALAAAPGSPQRQRYLFRPGSGDGSGPPNDWRSVMGGPAWTQVAGTADAPGEWYLHLFAPEQPDLDWDHPDIGADFEQTLRFWFDRGVDGFRIDVAHSLVKQAGLPDLGDTPRTETGPDHPHWDRDAVHEVYRRWRAVADSYDPPRVFVAEAWVDQPERLARYVRPDELHTAFNFDFLRAPWLAPALRQTIDRTLAAHAEVGAPPTWVLSNHDVARQVSRYARPQHKPVSALDDIVHLPADLALGTRRARAAVLLMLALPGGAYVYQGEELGLPEVEDLPEDALADPVWEQSGHQNRGRDGCRVPLPWSGGAPPYGFAPGGVPPWLPQPAGWGALSVAAQDGDPDSMLSLYRAALRLRRSTGALGEGPLSWRDAPDQVLRFDRGPGFDCLVNLSDQPVTIPVGGRLLLASAPLTADGQVPPDTAVWLDSAVAP